MDYITREINKIVDEVIRLRRDFHTYPELGFEEHRTAEIVETFLREIGITTRRVAGTGVVGMINGDLPGPTLMLRADLDALPIYEENDIPYCSKIPGIMHACGHDAHTAMLLGAAKILNSMRAEISGNIKLVFQPNEENAGAINMIEEGVLDTVDAVMGIHVWSQLQSGMISVSSGAVLAGMEVFKITVKGIGGHTGSPETCADSILAATDIVQTTQRIQTREISALKPTVIMFGSISGGTKANIIPDTVVLEGTCRTLYTDGGEEKPMERLKRLSEQVCKIHGCSCIVEWYRENNTLINDNALTQKATVTAVEILGDSAKVVPLYCLGSEDFSEFSKRVPGVFVFLGVGDRSKECHYPHHNPRFNIDEDALHNGVEMYVRFTLSLLSEIESS